MNIQSKGPITADKDLLWLPDMESALAGIRPQSFEYASGFIPTEQQKANAALLAASYSAFDKAGREMNIDAVTMARKIDIRNLIKLAHKAAKVINERIDTEDKDWKVANEIITELERISS